MTDALTLVDLIWEEGRIEHWIRFGRPVYEHRQDRHRRTLGFAPGSRFAYVRWAANSYGTVVSRIDILQAVAPGAAYQTVPFVRPGGEILLKQNGWPKVEQVLLLIDAVAALGIDPAAAAPDYWRHVQNRLSAGLAPRRYSMAQHRAWLKRARVRP